MDPWELLEYVGELLVFIGVVGEVFAEWREPHRKKLAKASSIVLVMGLALSLAALKGTNEDFNGQIADSNLKASQANERSTKAETGNIKLGVDLATAQRELSDQQAKTAQAELALLKLQQRLAWRRVTPQQYEAWRKVLLPFAGSKILIAVRSNEDDEAKTFASDLFHLFHDGGKWDATLNDSGVQIPLPYGVSCRLEKEQVGTPVARAFIAVMSKSVGAQVTPIEVTGYPGVAQVIVGLRSPP